jgi:hypothetical protein
MGGVLYRLGVGLLLAIWVMKAKNESMVLLMEGTGHDTIYVLDSSIVGYLYFSVS